MNPLDLLERAGATGQDAIAHARHILGDPVLRNRARTVETFDTELHQLTLSMARVLMSAGGVGLAAPQVGRCSRAVIYRMADHEGQPLMALINPSWQPLSDETDTAVEGCLSIPGLQLPVSRHTSIHVEARSAAGNVISFDTHGLEARIIQHEIDHLDGVLILDRVAARDRYEALLRFGELAPPAHSPALSDSVGAPGASSRPDLAEQMRRLREASQDH